MSSAPFMMQDWEGAKENIQPAREGRKPHILSSLYSAESENGGDNPLLRRDKLAAERAQWERQIASQCDEESDDPLELYSSFVKWLRASYTQGNNADSCLLSALEQVTRKFSHDSRYKNDPRFVRCWLWYAEALRDPADCYAFMVTNEVGQQIGAFFEDYAIFTEFGLKRMNEADQIYQIGIARNAQPIERLKKQYSDFKLRFAANQGITDRAANGFRGNSGFSMPSQAAPSAFTAKFKVFCDGSNAVSERSAKSLVAPWFKLTESATGSKENTVLPKPWAGETYQNKALSSAANSNLPKLQVFRDKVERIQQKGYNCDMLYDNGKELSFEEIRAKRYRDLVAKMDRLSVAQQQPKPQQSYAAFERPLPQPRQEYFVASPEKVVQPGKNQSKLASEQLSAKYQSSHFSQEQSSPHVPSPTVNTKAALDIINQMFNDPLSDEAPPSSIAEMSPPKAISVYQDNTADVRKIMEKKKELEPIIAQNEPALIPVRKSILKNVPLANHQPILEEEKNDNIADQENPFVDRAAVRIIRSPPTQRFPVNSIASSAMSTAAIDNIVVFSEKYTHDMLARLSSKLSALRGYHLLNTQSPNAHLANKKTLKDEDLILGDDTYYIRRELGEGAFGKVVLASHVGSAKDITIQPMRYAIKIQTPPNAWEFFILKQIHSRLPSSLRQSIIGVHDFYEYSDRGYLKLQYNDHGTLHSLLTYQNGGVFDEILCMYYTVEIIKTMNALHQSGFIHCDVKADNFLIRMAELDDESAWSTQYHSDGRCEWDKKGLQLIDFGRSVDVTLLPEGAALKVPWKPADDDCWQVKEGKAVTFELDYHGMAGVIHQMLFGTFMKIVKDPSNNEQWKCSSTFKRYWNVAIWQKLFGLLLNPPVRKEELPAYNDLLKIQEEIEAILTTHTKAPSLKSLLTKQEILIYEKAGE